MSESLVGRWLRMRSVSYGELDEDTSMPRIGQRQPAERYPPMRTDRSAPLPTFDLATDGTPSAIGRIPARFS